MAKDPLCPLGVMGRAGTRGDLSTPGPGAEELNEAPWPTPRCEWRRLGGTRSSLDSKPPLAAVPGGTRECGHKLTPQDREGRRQATWRLEAPCASAGAPSAATCTHRTELSCPIPHGLQSVPSHPCQVLRAVPQGLWERADPRDTEDAGT